MELGLLVDFRSDASAGVKILLTPDGLNLYNALLPLLNKIDMTFKEGGKAEISWAMNNESTINSTIESFLNENPVAKSLMSRLLLKVDAISLLLRYLYGVARSSQLSKNKVYTEFFACPFVARYCEIKGIEVPTEEGAKHRIPFLFNILETLGIIEQGRFDITVKYFFPTYDLIKFEEGENEAVVEQRITDLLEGTLSDDDISMLRENFGPDFGSNDYYLPIHR